MFEYIRKARQSEEGFTLIELLMVIVILGILAGVVVFAVNGIQDKGQASACKADLSSVQTAVEAYYAQNNAYPAGANSAARLAALVPAFLHAPSTNVTIDDDAGTVSFTATCAAAVAKG
jgi:general secretion pathway protein G